LTVTKERTYAINDEDEPRQEDIIIWHKPGKNPKMGKALDQIFLLSMLNVQ